LIIHGHPSIFIVMLTLLSKGPLSFVEFSSIKPGARSSSLNRTRLIFIQVLIFCFFITSHLVFIFQIVLTFNLKSSECRKIPMTLIFLLANVFIKKTSDRQVEKEPIYQTHRQHIG